MKTVLITGASKGIGKATAILFAKNGYNTVINYNTDEKSAKELETTLNKSGFSAFSVKADVSDKAQVNSMINAVNAKFGGVDALVNNAGIAHFSQVNYLSEEDYDKVFAVNMKGAHLVTQAVLDGMISKKNGAIVNVSSIWGKVGSSCEAVYSASKSAIIGYTKALSKELGLSNIRVNCVCPGVIDTQMNAVLSEETILSLKDDISLNRLGRAEEVAEAIFFLASDKASYITGQVLTVDGGFIE